MSIYSDVQIARCLAAAGASGAGLVIGIAVCLAESGGNTNAVNTTGNHPISRDRGLWQINSYYHPEVTDTCAFDPYCCARAAYRISNHASTWAPWCTYTNGSYARFLSRARVAASQVNTTTYTLTRYLMVGCAGDDVRRCQKIVGASVDGMYGPLTRAAVQRWQAAHKLTADGVVGPDTCHAFGWVWAG